MSSKHFTKAALLFAFIMTGSLTLVAQKNDSLLQKRIQSQQYVFVPLSVSSPSFTVPINSTEYKIRVTVDSVIAILPYLGKSDGPQFGRSSDDEALVFTSTNFEYSAVAKKKGRWEIKIEPKDAKGIRLFLIVYNNGEAQMDVISPRRETMLVKGYVW